MFLGRHTRSNFNEVYPGHLDLPDHVFKPKAPDEHIPDLSPYGRREARALGYFLEKNDVAGVVTARTRRAAQTGAIATEGLGIPMFVDGDLNEINWGKLGGRKADEVLPTPVPTDGPHRGLDFRPHPSVETPLEAAARARRALERDRINQGEELPKDRLFYIMSKSVMQSLFAETLEWDRAQMLHPENKIANGQVMWFDLEAPEPPVSIFVPRAEIVAATPLHPLDECGNEQAA